MGELTRAEFDRLAARVHEGAATAEELDLLEPYRARRAVMLASGFGARMMPVTKACPKPLVRIHGVRIIDSLLDALVDAGIEEIYLVRGYLAERFDELLGKYPSLRFIDNPDYASTNNISSAVLAAAHFENAYVFESDLFLKNPALITRYQYQSNYLGVPVEHTDDWCFTTEGGVIRDLKKGGDCCHHMYGISYWSAEDGRRLADDLPRAFEDGPTKQRFWDDVPCVICRENYEVVIRACSFDDIDEIDSFEELCAIDESYRGWE
ncbi:MAG TPA: phosphocholine cytidylyltransferase family protein [Atopobiaceae bacterium]|nr:phosphocholine cytidylyltransferase family protein [Atopobiaceae bacterium]